MSYQNERRRMDGRKEGRTDGRTEEYGRIRKENSGVVSYPLDPKDELAGEDSSVELLTWEVFIRMGDSPPMLMDILWLSVETFWGGGGGERERGRERGRRG
jgi:hypothetical protein